MLFLKPWIGYEITFCLPQKNLPDTSQNIVGLSPACPASLICNFPELANLLSLPKVEANGHSLNRPGQASPALEQPLLSVME